MRIIGTFVLAAATALTAVQLPGCASDGGRTAGQTVDDAALTARVKTALAKDEGIGKAMDVNVTTYQGTVQLSGFVQSRDLANRAGEVARTVQGVKSVKNDLQVVAQGSRSGSSAGAGSSSPNPQGSSGY